MPISTLTSKGQVTIPKEIRSRMGLKTGDRLDFRIDDRGRITVQPTHDPGFRRLRGMLHRYAKDRPVTVEEMNDGVETTMAEKYGRPPR